MTKLESNSLKIYLYFILRHGVIVCRRTVPKNITTRTSKPENGTGPFVVETGFPPNFPDRPVSMATETGSEYTCPGQPSDLYYDSILEIDSESGYLRPI